MSEQCTVSVHNDYGVGFHRCSRGATVQNEGKWYCWQHDPDRVAAEREAEQASERARRDKSAANQAEASEILTALGVEGRAELRGFRYVRRLVISFDEARKIIERLP